MLLDAASLAETVYRGNDARSRSLAMLIRFVEERFGASLVFDARSLPLGRADLFEEVALAATLLQNRVITRFGPVKRYVDEPRSKFWTADCNVDGGHVTAGMSFNSDNEALRASLCEALERYIWYTHTDFLGRLRSESTAAIARRGAFVAPSRVAGFSETEREGRKDRALAADSTYRWAQGTSLVTGVRTWLPAQLVSGAPAIRAGYGEPQIRAANTNGLATWTTQNGARLAGALELIERDAYMTLWLNQLSLPRVATTQLRSYPTLGTVLAACDRYRLAVHAIQLPTDAPTHAIATVVEDRSGSAPRFSIGLNAHRNLERAVMKSLTEALRARIGVRRHMETAPFDQETPVDKIGHRDRLWYWAEPSHASRLEFLIQGPETSVERTVWESDDEDTHLSRLIDWCRSREYECISVPLTHSRGNPTDLHIEMTVIPELQPVYLTEGTRALGCDRWRTVPPLLGLTARATPFTDAPHPFS